MAVESKSARRNARLAAQQPVPDEQTARQIRDLYANVARAVATKDVDAIATVVTEDSRSIGLHGEVLERDAWLADMKSDFDSVKRFDSVEYSVDKVVVRGDSAVAYLTERFSGLMTDDPRTQDREPNRSFQSVITSRDVLVHDQRGWRIRESESIKSEFAAQDKTHTSAQYARLK